MFHKKSKTLFYMKIMVCKIPPGGSGTLSGQWPIRAIPDEITWGEVGDGCRYIFL